MKTVVSALLALGLLAGTVAEANAVTCARGVYRAGCVGPHGAAVTTRGRRGARPTLLLSRGRARLPLRGGTARKRRRTRLPHSPARFVRDGALMCQKPNLIAA